MNPDALDASLKQSLPVRIAWGVLIAATLYVCYFSHLGTIGFVGPDEPRYAWIARDMVETGDWVTPRLYGKPWFEKPVLYYWGAALSFKLFGVSEAAARLPSAVSALLATLALAWLARRVYGGETARWLLLLLPTTVGMIGFSHAASTDMPFSAMLTIAMVCAAVVLGLTQNEKTPILPRTPWLALLLFGFFLGLAVLAKGPAAIILVGGGVFFWALFTWKWKEALRLLHPVAILSFCATALPWYILCTRRNPDFFRVFIIEHNFKRFLTPEFQHIQPFWYYGPILFLAFFPSTVVLLSNVGLGIKRLLLGEAVNPITIFLSSWAAFCVLFFSISQSKLPGYILPAIPPTSLLCARFLTGASTQRSTMRWVGIGTGVLFLLVGYTVRQIHARIPVVTDLQPAPLVTTVSFLAICGGFVCLVVSIWKPSRHFIVATAVTVLVILSLGTADLWQLDAGVSARRTYRTAAGYIASENLASAKTYKLRRDYRYALNFYAHREIPEWTLDDGNSVPIFAAGRSAYEKNTEDLQKAGVSCSAYVAIPAVILCGKPSRRWEEKP